MQLRSQPQISAQDQPENKEDWQRSREFYMRSSDAFDRASRSVEVITHDIEVAGVPIRLQFGGRPIEQALFPALAQNLFSDAGRTPDLTLSIWDSATSGVAHPSPTWGEEDFRDRGTIAGIDNDRFRACFQMGPDSLSLLDMEAGRGLFWVRDAAELPYYERGAPLRNLLHWWMGVRGRVFIHAAAVGITSGAVLIVGRGGSGKSTTALSGLAFGLRYVSDDYCVISLADGPIVHNVYSTAKLTRDSSNRFPELDAALGKTDVVEGEKRLLFLNSDSTLHLTPELPVCAVMVPEVVEGQIQTEVVPSTRARALTALAPSSLFQLAGAGDAEFRRCAELVRTVPVVSARLGSDLAGVAEAIQGYLSSRVE